MRVHIGGDHAAYELLGELVSFLEGEGHEVTNHGPHTLDPEDDYPVFVLRAAEAVAADPESLGVVLGGSGNGEQMAANKVDGARAALVWSVPTAELARQHNDANIISIGARQHTVDEAMLFIDTFIATPFSNEPRHERRIKQLHEYETTGAIAGHELGV